MTFIPTLKLDIPTLGFSESNVVPAAIEHVQHRGLRLTDISCYRPQGVNTYTIYIHRR